MKLTSESITINLPDDLLWRDEFNWTPVQKKTQYSLSGSLIVEASEKLAGRPISLEPPDDEMAWVPRSTVELLFAWAESPEREMTLELEYPNDTRTFTVIFAPDERPIEAEPVKKFPQHADDDWFLVKIKLIEVV